MGFLDKLKEMAAALQRGAAPVDPVQFNDPLALKTEWSPLKRGGANFRTHQLSVASPMRYEFRSTLLTRIFPFLFIVAGMFPLGSTLAGFTWPPKLEDLLPILMGLVFIGAGTALFVVLRRPIVFDKAAGWFWKGRAPEGAAATGSPTKRACRLADVHALQLVRERISGKNAYDSYELNLVLRDASRINVVDHGNLAVLREDAARLATAMGWKVWDATVTTEGLRGWSPG